MSPSKIATKIVQAQAILKDFGLPADQQNQISALTLLALCGLRVSDPWSKASRDARTVTKGVMDFISQNYRITYAPNTRETVRRQVLHQFVLAGVANYNPFEPDLPTNSPRAHYAVSEAALNAIRSYRTVEYEPLLAQFLSTRTTLIEFFERRRSKRLVPITLPDGTSVRLSPGAHNKLQKAIVEQFAPQFVESAKLLYLGDTAEKNLIHHAETLNSLRIPVTEHNKLPDT